MEILDGNEEAGVSGFGRWRISGSRVIGGTRPGLAALLPAACGGTLLLLAACGGPTPAPPAADGSGNVAAGEQLRLVPTMVADVVDVPGEITTRDRAEAMPRIAGTLAKLDVRAGDRVRKGQRIGLVVDQRIGFEAGAAEAQVAAAAAGAAEATASLARIRQLYEKKVYAKARLDQAEAAAEAADAALAAARARAAGGRSVVSQGAILSPADGRVLRADVPEGSVVAPGQSVATITAGAAILRLDLPESLGQKVGAGTIVRLADGRSGQISQLYPAVVGGRVRADATLPGLDGGLVGQRLSARIEAGMRPALLVPARFITTRYGIDSVELLGADRRPESVPVQIVAGPGSGTGPSADMVEILSGVRAGDTLIPAGAAK